jgi:hypothetical protein
VYELHADYSDKWFAYFSNSSDHNSLLDAFFAMVNNKNIISAIEPTKEGSMADEDEAEQDFFHLCVAVLAALTYVPCYLSKKSYAQKCSVARVVCEKLLENTYSTFTEKWFLYLRHPTSCINSIKTVYSLCMASARMCEFIASQSGLMELLLDILSGKVANLI